MWADRVRHEGADSVSCAGQAHAQAARGASGGAPQERMPVEEHAPGYAAPQVGQPAGTLILGPERQALLVSGIIETSKLSFGL